MEDILASIRRILSEDETPAGDSKADEHAAPVAAEGDGVLVLDPGMLVTDPAHEAEPVAEPPPLRTEPTPPPPAPAAPPPVFQEAPSTLLAPEVADAAASSVSSLMRTVMDRSTLVRSGGPTIEDIVREEIRPLLKAWLDEHLPPLVERLVRTEIERVVARAAP